MSQEEERSSKSKHSFGFNVGMTTGLGFSYSYMSNKFGIDITSIPVYTQKEKLYTFQGIALNFIVKKKERSDQFVYIGNSLMYSREYVKVMSDFIDYSTGYSFIKKLRHNYLYRAGGGWGLRIKGKNKFDWTLRMGAMWYSNWHGEYGVLPSVGIAIHYKL